MFDGDDLIGAANLFRLPIGDERDVAYLAHVGVAGTDRPHVRELTAALILRSLEWAGDAGLRVRFEADEWYAPPSVPVWVLPVLSSCFGRADGMLVA